jgi:hypothetical protein
MNILSIDCAIKSLAICYLSLDINELRKIPVLIDNIINILDCKDSHVSDSKGITKKDSQVSDIFEELLDIALKKYIKIHIMKVCDLSTIEKKQTTVERSIALKKCMNGIDAEILLLDQTYRHIDKVLIEYQMSANDKSRCVSQQLIYHYSDYTGINSDCKGITKKDLKNKEGGKRETSIHLVGPSLKNKIHFSPDLTHSVFTDKYMSKYTANKNHTKANLLFFLKVYKLEHLIKDNNIKKKNIDDIADAFMQIHGWLIYGVRS